MVRGTWNPARVYTQETTTLQINTYINHRTNEKVFLKRKRPENTGVYVCAHLPSRDKPRKDFHLPSSIFHTMNYECVHSVITHAQFNMYVKVGICKYIGT